MRITPEEIELLLHEEEGTSLDFKQEQYKFDRARKDDKSELLKDLLAFTNSFRRTDACILVGVQEVRGGRSKVTGVKAQLDDAKLQQFVNSKTQSPITFSYMEAILDGHAIGIIHIPMQARPIYSKDAYGKVQKEAVYVRRGSSTDIAKPDEIARMGTAGVDWVKKPSVELSLFDRKTGDPLDNYVSIDRCTWYDLPPNEEIPEYSPGNRSFILNDKRSRLFEALVNIEYLRQMSEYIPRSACFALSLELRNTGGISIHDTSLVIELRDPNQRYQLLTSRDCAGKPHPIISYGWLPPRSITEKDDVFVEKGRRYMAGKVRLWQDPAWRRGTADGRSSDR